MIFEKIIGIKNRPEGINIVVREAVRAIVMEDTKILMVYNSRGDFKFPGGGIEEKENHNAEAHWIDIENAIINNEKVMAKKDDNNPWVVRELYVLNKLKEYKGILF